MEKSQSTNAEPCFPHDNIVGGHSRDECRLSNALTVCHRLLSTRVTARASLFTDQRMSGLPTRARYKHYKTICEHILTILQPCSNSSFLKLWSSKQSVETSCNCSISHHCAPGRRGGEEVCARAYFFLLTVVEARSAGSALRQWLVIPPPRSPPQPGRARHLSSLAFGRRAAR